MLRKKLNIALVFVAGSMLLSCNDTSLNTSPIVNEKPHTSVQKAEAVGPPNLSRDFDLMFERMFSSVCLRQIRKTFSMDKEVLVWTYGPTLISADFNAKTAKQKEFISILSNGNQIVRMQDREILIKAIENSSCKLAPNELSHPILRDMTQEYYDEVSKLIANINNGTATYADLAKIIKAEEQNNELIFEYIFQEEPSLVQEIGKKWEKNNSKLMSAMAPLQRIMEQYDL